MAETTENVLLRETPFNLNDTVKVKLTDRGREIYAANRSVNFAFSESEVLRQLDARTDADGYTKFQLYVLMAIFGDSIPDYPTMNEALPFETGIILVPDPITVRLAELSL